MASKSIFLLFFETNLRLIGHLDSVLTNTNDDDAYEWWCKQNISSNSVPTNITTSNGPKWNEIPTFKIIGKVKLPRGSISCGPIWISGNCLNSGVCQSLPWHFIFALIAVFCSIGDMYLKYNYDAELHQQIDYIWLFAVCLCNCAPFWAYEQLFDTRIFCNV